MNRQYAPATGLVASSPVFSMAAIVRQKVRKGRKRPDVVRASIDDQAVTNVDTSRDMYGFAVRPQHVARYKEYSRIYQEEETERAERWDHFLTSYVEPGCEASPANAERNTLATHSLPRELEANGRIESDKARESSADSLPSPATRSESDATALQSPSAVGNGGEPVRSWSMCRRSLWAVEQALRLQARKHGFANVHASVSSESTEDAGRADDNEACVTPTTTATEHEETKKKRHRKPTTSDAGLLTIMRRKSGTVLPLDAVLVDDLQTAFRQQDNRAGTRHGMHVYDRSVSCVNGGESMQFGLLRTVSLPPLKRVPSSETKLVIAVDTGDNAGLGQQLPRLQETSAASEELLNAVATDKDEKSGAVQLEGDAAIVKRELLKDRSASDEYVKSLASVDVAEAPDDSSASVNKNAWEAVSKAICKDVTSGETSEGSERFEDCEESDGECAEVAEKGGEHVTSDGTVGCPKEPWEKVEAKVVKYDTERESGGVEPPAEQEIKTRSHDGSDREELEDVPLGPFNDGGESEDEGTSPTGMGEDLQGGVKQQQQQQQQQQELLSNGWDEKRQENKLEKPTRDVKVKVGDNDEETNGHTDDKEDAPVVCTWHDELRSLVRGGVPMAMRGELWQLFSGAKWRKIPGHYNALLVLLADGGGDGDGTGGLNTESRSAANYQKTENGILEKWTSQIEKDLPRTFPGHPALDQNGRNALRRLLTAYARHNPSVGYCQGMNFLAALLLLLMPEEAAFWCLVAIIDDYFEGYYTEKMVEAQVDQLVLDNLVRKYFPRVVSHLDSLGVQVAWISGPWFLSVFVNVLPWESVLRVWDALLYEGNRSMLFRTALALIDMQAQAILATKDVGDAVSVLQNMASSTFDSSQLVLIASMGYADVTEELLCSVREEYRPSVLESVEARTIELSRWRTTSDEKRNDKSEPTSRRFDYEPESEDDRHQQDSTKSSPLIEDKMPVEHDGRKKEERITWSDDESFDVTELITQVKWLKGELARALEAEQLLSMRLREFNAMRDQQRVLNEERAALKEQVELMHIELKDTKELLREKEDHTKALTEVMVRMDEEQRATEGHRLQAEAIASSLEKELAEEKVCAIRVPGSTRQLQ
ncbi:hypothetical protein CBR_g29911 [Chara braunii]|uniref:Rab-GAP TBC domain-containing protein n=1 Tax=Chara braunii TaxID=69332 RepID=A0A388JWW5_CHABU|nr:hypothetical protein CBR_g29911 [Chara braunii]|eukprot:GBG62301.1 hypothetical protein CBR_g29911 [Chara braunii]